MAGRKDIPKIPNPPSGDGHLITHRYMTATELAEREARQSAYDAMLARQAAFERSRETAADKPEPVRAGCVFAKSCKLPDAVIDYANPSGMVPTDSLKDYGDLILLGAREADASGGVPLRKISGAAIPAGLGTFALAGSLFEALPTVAAGTAAATLTGLVALLMPLSLGDSALYTDDQLRALKQARTRVRLRIEQQEDGNLKGYGFYTGKHRDWEMVKVVQFASRGSQYTADLGEGIELIWTPANDGADTLGIPALEAAPQAPHIWVYPPTEAADSILVNPVYPPEYRDFILVFPADSGVRPVYIVVSAPHGNYHQKPNFLPAFPDARWATPKTPIKGGGGLRPRWKDRDGTIYEWDFQHGAVETYTKRGKHLGEFNHETGAQTKPADPTRKVEP
ncbi:S-type pyocin domain-containing protein [Pseudomonas sp. B35(2017)]|uniref:S-type pyocin domain-containing protein n=1 Tax=Pseudomonas sp. B35(2017) TaxID=1981722 RepID=UPI000A1E8B0D|nr:S-type pyocin domain-containing protein [Pseudomonas sp. B35(2017)]